jgi:putative hydrolase of HD superfamily
MPDQKSNYPSIDRIEQLQQFIADFAKVQRMPHLADTGRPENDVEHSYGLAMTCWFLAPKIAPELELGKILQYALAHDLVEIHAGDTFVFGEKAHIDSKPAREHEALRILAADWPDFMDIHDFAQGYMDKVNEEAKFVKAVDKLLPMLMINLGEQAAFWQRHKVTLDMEIENKHTIEVSDHMAPYYDKLVAWMQANNHFYQDSADSQA